MALRPIIDTCEPRPDVLKGGLTDAHFAAQLDQVVRDPTQYPVYGDPTSFFAVTYPTEGLKALLASTFGRLSGKAGKVHGAEHGVVRFQTSFGGGKTHGLIAAYHLASGARTPSIGEFVDPDLLPDDCRVAAVVGDTLDASVGVEIGGHKVQTMWGAIAAQLGDEAWAAVEQQDSTRTAPGTDIWKAIFGAAPTLVIIDEVAEHLRNLSTSGDSKLRRQAEAMPSFLFSLFTAAAQVTTARVVITLATAADAFGKETADVEKVLDEGTEAGKDARSVIGRFREILVPAQDEEIAAIIRRRLFSTVDDKAAREAAIAFNEYYSSLEKRQAGVELAAPELSVDAHTASPAADIYSLGQVIGWALTASHPQPNVPLVPSDEPWRHIVKVSTEFNPEDRPQDGRALIDLISLEMDAPPVPPAIKGEELLAEYRSGRAEALNE